MSESTVKGLVTIEVHHDGAVAIVWSPELSAADRAFAVLNAWRLVVWKVDEGWREVSDQPEPGERP